MDNRCVTVAAYIQRNAAANLDNRLQVVQMVPLVALGPLYLSVQEEVVSLPEPGYVAVYVNDNKTPHHMTKSVPPLR